MTILITGGASGIGLAYTKRFLADGAKVIAVGRREDKLEEARQGTIGGPNPGLITHPCDIESEAQRIELRDWTLANHPDINAIMNNAGIQRRINLLEPEEWSETQRELTINLSAPIHLSRLFIPHFLKQPKAEIINVTSGLSFSPLANVPVYCSTKAALHSFTLSLRYQLRNTPIKVIELIPPAVDTDLGGPGLHTFGENLDAFADDTFAKYKSGEIEISYGTAGYTSRTSDGPSASRPQLNDLFNRMNP